ncbi:lantibiotic dehydratase [Streptomyces hoynatensis]|uniref:Lantibiotic dehydratase n=1 Tax=Streptomyces hoynatensis TaxID=1141874 RepID=A0A3A9Z844_9ACTN|nr:lantibiotic dehydratase [Streptomyces hoynatensis]RKN43994.1 lantibiotic dehydratase [Streptomyces hoynatensis]
MERPIQAPTSAGAPEAGPWHMVPRFVLRRAGFGFPLLDHAGDPAAGHAAAAYRQATRELDETRERLLGDAMRTAVGERRRAGDRAGLRRLSTLRNRIGRRLPVDAGEARALLPHLDGPLDAYAAALTAQAAAREELWTALAKEEAGREARLREALGPQVLDAVLQMTPDLYDGVRRWLATSGPGRSGERAMARRLYLVLQRLAAKNETSSFFGPLVHGRVAPGIDGVRLGPETASGVTEVRPFMAFWAVCALAARLAEAPGVGERLPVRWLPAARLDGRVLTLPTGRSVGLSGASAAVAAAVGRDASAADVARATGLPLPEVSRILDRFESVGALRRRPEPASTTDRPFSELLADARRYAADTPWPARLADLWRAVEEYGAAGGHLARRRALDRLERGFEELAGVAPRRAGGRMYADRTVAYLDAKGDLSPVLMGEDTRRRLEAALGPALDVGARYGELLHAAHQRFAREVLRSAGVAAMPYPEFVRRSRAALEAEGPPGAAGPRALARWAGEARAFAAEFAALVLARTRDGRARLTPRELRALGEPDHRPRFAGPDVLVGVDEAGRPGTFVLGEVHPYVFAWGSQGLFAEEPGALQADFARDLSPWGGASRMATVIRRRRHKGLVGEWFPGRFVEVTATACRDRARSVPVTELTVRAEGEGVRLWDGRGELVLYAGEDDHVHLLAFAPPAVRMPPAGDGRRRPRVTVGEVVMQRASWLVEPAELRGTGHGGRTGTREAFLGVQRLRARLGLPRWVYAHVPGQPKPVCVDLSAPLAVEALRGLLPGTADAIALTEMLPAPDRLWLARNGEPVTSELRLALIRRGGA